MSYNTMETANAYFATRLDTSVWDKSPDALKTKALGQASRAIDSLNYVGNPVNTDAEFPRTGMLTIPNNILWAECEEAIVLLSGRNAEFELTNINSRHLGFGQVDDDVDTKLIPEHVANGILSGTAWQYLKPFLMDPRAITLSRRN